MEENKRIGGRRHIVHYLHTLSRMSWRIFSRSSSIFLCFSFRRSSASRMASRRSRSSSSAFSLLSSPPSSSPPPTAPIYYQRISFNFPYTFLHQFHVLWWTFYFSPISGCFKSHEAKIKKEQSNKTKLEKKKRCDKFLFYGFL